MLYEHRLNTLWAESLEMRKVTLDLAMIYQISRSIVTIDDNLFTFEIDSQKNKSKVFKPQCTSFLSHVDV